MTAIAPHIASVRAFVHPPESSPVVEEIASGKFEMKTATKYAAPTAPPWKIVSPITIDSGIPSSTVPRHNRERGSLFVGACRLLAATATVAIDEPVADGEDQTTGEQPSDECPVVGRELRRLLHKVERHRADEHARAESHDEAGHAQTQPEEHRNDGSDYERRAREDSPAEGFKHPCYSLSLAAGDRGFVVIISAAIVGIASHSRPRPH